MASRSGSVSFMLPSCRPSVATGFRGDKLFVATDSRSPSISDAWIRRSLVLRLGSLHRRSPDPTDWRLSSGCDHSVLRAERPLTAIKQSLNIATARRTSVRCPRCSSPRPRTEPSGAARPTASSSTELALPTHAGLSVLRNPHPAAAAPNPPAGRSANRLATVIASTRGAGVAAR